MTAKLFKSGEFNACTLKDIHSSDISVLRQIFVAVHFIKFPISPIIIPFICPITKICLRIEISESFGMPAMLYIHPI